MTPITLSLPAMLPRIREAFDLDEIALGSCSYAGPCAIGLFIPIAERARFDVHPDGSGYPTVSVWIDMGDFVVAPGTSWLDLTELQEAADAMADPDAFPDTLARLEAKYAPR